MAEKPQHSDAPTPPRRSLATMKRDALRASPFFAHMRPEELDEIIATSTERRTPRGTTIFTKGEPGSYMLAVLTGHIRVGSVSLEGREVTLNVIGPCEIVGEIALLDGKPRSADAVAVEDTTMMVIERKHFLPFLVRHEGLVERMLVVLCDRLRKTSTALEEIALFDLNARLARLLVKLGADYGRPHQAADGASTTRLSLKFSQRDLSTLVASSRESVNKQLRLWREAEIVDMDEGHIVLRDIDALRSLFES